MSTRRVGGSRRRNRALQWLLMGSLGLLAALYVAAYVFADERLPQGTRIEGVAVGGLTPQRASAVFAREMAGRAPDSIEVRAGKRTLVVLARDAGLRVDAAASVAQVPVGGSWNPLRLWELYTSPRRYEAVVASGPGLQRQLKRFAGRVERSPVPGGIELREPTPVAIYPRVGSRLVTAGARAAILDAYISGKQVVRVQVARVSPPVSSAEVDRVMSQFAVPAMSAPVTFTFEEERVLFVPPSTRRTSRWRLATVGWPPGWSRHG